MTQGAADAAFSMKTDPFVVVLSVLFLVFHVAVGFAVLRSALAFKAIPLLNSVVACGLLVYWIRHWLALSDQGLTFFGRDGWFVVYALVVLAFSLACLPGRTLLKPLHIALMSLHGICAVLLLLFAVFFRMNRLF